MDQLLQKLFIMLCAFASLRLCVAPFSNDFVLAGHRPGRFNTITAEM